MVIIDARVGRAVVVVGGCGCAACQRPKKMLRSTTSSSRATPTSSRQVASERSHSDMPAIEHAVS